MRRCGETHPNDEKSRCVLPEEHHDDFGRRTKHRFVKTTAELDAERIAYDDAPGTVSPTVGGPRRAWELNAWHLGRRTQDFKPVFANEWGASKIDAWWARR
jgi:hypothetical protein